MNSCELTAFITAIANVIFKQYSTQEIALIAAVLTQLGDTLVTKIEFDNVCNIEEK